MYKGIPLDHLTKGGLIRLLPEVISGAEEDGQKEGSTEGGPKPAPPKKEADPDPVEEEEEESEEEEDKDKDEKTKGLRSALAKERKARTDAEKALKKRQREDDAKALAEKSEIEQANTKLSTAQTKLEKLAEGFIRTTLNSAIRAAAKDFIDPADAIEGVDRSLLSYEVDDDDPSKVTVDAKSVTAAVKALATKKPHFLKQEGTEDGQPTGGQFGGSQKKKTTEEEDLRKLYPNL